MAESTSMHKASEPQVERAERTRAGRAYRPNVDIIEMRDELVVLADMPGTKPEDVDINFEKGTLEIHAKVCSRVPDNAQPLLAEYGVGDFYRTFQVSEAVDASQISAEYRDGVLILHLPKVEAVKPRKIAIKGA